MYHENYEPLTKFYQKEFPNKAINGFLKSTSINLNSEPAESENQINNGYYWKKKTSDVHVNKLSRKRIKQVWIRKQSN